MNRMKAYTATALAALALGTLPAAAQMFGGPGGGMMGPGFGIGARMGGMTGTALAQAQLDLLHTQLHITTAQEPAWQAFAAAAVHQALGMDNALDTRWQATTNAADRLMLHAQLMDDRAADMLAVAQAFKGLYNVLSTDQRTAVDAYFMGGGITRPSGFFR